ncbi:MAG: hypothetical protein HRU01_27250 [Myxococcales bacterium]|nr:hypothetical protein [Myxococcales bacterium]
MNLRWNRTSTLILVFVYVCASAFLVSSWMKGRHEPGVRIEKYTYPERAADFDQVPPRRPYAYRVLVPLLLRNAVRPIPFEDRRDWSVELVRSEPVTARLLGRFAVKPRFIPEFTLHLLLQTGCVFGFAWFLRKQYHALYEAPGLAADVAPLVAIFMAMSVYDSAAYHYDLPQLFFFTASLYAITSRSWRWFYLVVILGFVNKETMCLISLAFVSIVWRDMARRDLIRHLAAQVAIFVSLRAAIVYSFGPIASLRPGNDALRDNFLKNLQQMAGSDAFDTFALQMAIAFASVMVISHYLRGPALLRRASILFVPFLAAYLKGGVWKELRVLGEVYPIAFMLFYGGVMELLRAPLDVKVEQRDRASVFRETPAVGRVVWLALMVGLAILLVLAAALPWVGRRALVEWLGL